MAQRNSRKPRNSGATRRPAGAKKGGGAPVWVWLVTGVLVGLFVAFLVFLARFDSSNSKPVETVAAGKETPAARNKEKPRSTDKDKQQADDVAPAAKPSAGTPPAAEPPKEKVAENTVKPAPTKKPDKSEKSAVNYDFYKILPQYEVVVPESNSRTATASAASAPGTYYLQVGAFRNIQEADGRKAELAMMGIVSSIQTVTDADSSWHRVRIGPVKDMRQLDRTKRQLQDNNIAFVTLKEK